MSVKKKTLKGVTTPLFKTPSGRFTSNAAIKRGDAFPTVGEELDVTQAYFAFPGTPTAEKFLNFTPTAGEFDVVIPGPTGSPKDWLAEGYENQALIIDGRTCSVSLADVHGLASDVKHHPELISSIARDVLRCQFRQEYDKSPEELKQLLLEQTAAMIEAPPDEFAQDVYQSGLGAAFAELGMSGEFVEAWARGPDALLELAVSRGIAEPGQDGVFAAQLAPFIGPEVQALGGITGRGVNFPQVELYELGKVHGDQWNEWLDEALSQHLASMGAANKFMAKTLKVALGDGVEQVVPVPVFSSQKGKEMPVQKVAEAVTEAEQIIDSQIIMGELQVVEQIATAIDAYLACQTPGNLLSFPIPSSAFGVDRINLKCNDPESFKQLNPPALALALANELAARTGAVGPLIAGEGDAAGPSLLPWLLAGGGLLIGGPLGAGAGYALGLSLERK